MNYQKHQIGSFRSCTLDSAPDITFTNHCPTDLHYNQSLAFSESSRQSSMIREEEVLQKKRKQVIKYRCRCSSLLQSIRSKRSVSNSCRTISINLRVPISCNSCKYNGQKHHWHKQNSEVVVKNKKQIFSLSLSKIKASYGLRCKSNSISMRRKKRNGKFKASLGRRNCILKFNFKLKNIKT